MNPETPEMTCGGQARQDTLTRQIQGAWIRGSTPGSPEGLVDAALNVVYQDPTGGAGVRLYIKTTALGTLTGWVAFGP